MSKETFTQCSHRDLLFEHRPDKNPVKLELKDLPNLSKNGLASPLRQASSVAIYTLAALAAQDFAHQAFAAPVVDLAQQSQIKQAGDGLPTAAEEARLASSQSAVASPESLNVQEFAPEFAQASAPLVTPSSLGESEAVAPTLKTAASESIRANMAPPGTEVRLARTSVQNEPSIRGVETEPSQQFLEREENFSSTASASPASNSPSPSRNPQLVAAKNLAALQSNSARDLQGVPTLEWSATSLSNREIPTLPGTVNPEQTRDIVAQATPTSSCLAYAPASQEAVNSQQTGKVVAQAVQTRFCPPVETLRQAEGLQNELRDLENVKVDQGFEASPALSIYIPTGFGADNNTGFIGATFQERTRYSNVSDGGAVIGVGLGDAQKAVGVELSYTTASFGGSRDFGGGGFNAKVHRQIGDGLAVAAGWNGFANLGGRNDFENSIYGVVSKVFRTRDDINSLFSRVAVTAGVGNGQFRTEDAVAKDDGGIGVFGNVAVRVARPVSLIAEWSGQDLGVGLSLAPFKNIPLVITPAVRDIVGAGDGPRFVLGTGLAFKF
ncbi:hypothetical protein [Allocoleopsis franciscana]|uniref:Uncharacterized protein n=1 Tax=Allocoleopsis franciscana PCC 7113 TaxID=1173027 RepID=K9WK14_9CYAN|nr:hypothetical protein [Allocoleopsis franciscana]AFZ20141.1 hypothetical protein Mic7113_4448 [Allocoleopsis franciscana PCC 7113]